MREICTSGSTRGEEPQGYPVAPSPTLPVRCSGCPAALNCAREQAACVPREHQRKKNRIGAGSVDF